MIEPRGHPLMAAQAPGHELPDHGGPGEETVRFVKESVIDASAERVFAFHEAPAAFERLGPARQTTEIVKPPTSLDVGTRVMLKVEVGPVWQTIVAEHVAYEPGGMFADRMVEGAPSRAGCIATSPPPGARTSAC